MQTEPVRVIGKEDNGNSEASKIGYTFATIHMQNWRELDSSLPTVVGEMKNLQDILERENGITELLTPVNATNSFGSTFFNSPIGNIRSYLYKFGHSFLKDSGFKQEQRKFQAQHSKNNGNKEYNPAMVQAAAYILLLSGKMCVGVHEGCKAAPSEDPAIKKENRRIEREQASTREFVKRLANSFLDCEAAAADPRNKEPGYEKVFGTLDKLKNALDGKSEKETASLENTSDILSLARNISVYCASGGKNADARAYIETAYAQNVNALFDLTMAGKNPEIQPPDSYTVNPARNFASAPVNKIA